MKQYVLSYYPAFKCSADKCKHTCCAGWKMQIDQNTLDFYKKDTSAFSNALISGINLKKSNFKTDKNKRCAFLNKDNLCDIIINLGEQSLCQVCRDHPRFRSFFEGFIETGLGLSCEVASKLVLSFDGKIEPILINDDGKNISLSIKEKYLLEFRKQALDIIQNSEENFGDRINALMALCKCDITKLDFNKIIKKYSSLERIEKNFTKRLKSIKNKTLNFSTNEKLSKYFEQFLVNSIFRHISSAEDTLDARARTVFCVISLFIINAIFENEKQSGQELNVLADIVRDFSTEIEYSQKNLDKLFSFCYNFIKI